jgi:hypothetical protein
MKKEMDASNVEGHLIHLAENESDDGTSTPVPKETCMILLTPTDNKARTIPPTGKGAGTTSQMSTNPELKDTPKPNWPATPSSKSSSFADDTEDKQYMSCFVDWHSFELDYTRMLGDETKMLAHHERTMGNEAIHIFQHTDHNDAELVIDARTQLLLAMYTMCEAMVLFDTQLGNMSYFSRGPGNWMADMEGGRRKWVCKEWKSLWFSFGCTFVSFLWVYGFSYGLWFLSRSIFVSFLWD